MNTNMRALLTLAVAAICLTGCVSVPQKDSTNSLANAGVAAQSRGDWDAAAQLFQQAIDKENVFWKSDFSRPSKTMAVLFYELGRSQGVLGSYSEAEKNLTMALHMDEQLHGPIGMDLVELARLNHARGDNAKALSYFEKVLPKMDEIAEADPAGHLELLKEATAAYEALGRIGRAAELREKTKRFSASHPNARFPKGYSWTPYKKIEVK